LLCPPARRRRDLVVVEIGKQARSREASRVSRPKGQQTSAALWCDREGESSRVSEPRLSIDDRCIWLWDLGRQSDPHHPQSASIDRQQPLSRCWCDRVLRSMQ
jgi:hypothetical protein